MKFVSCTFQCVCIVQKNELFNFKWQRLPATKQAPSSLKTNSIQQLAISLKTKPLLIALLSHYLFYVAHATNSFSHQTCFVSHQACSSSHRARLYVDSTQLSLSLLRTTYMACFSPSFSFAHLKVTNSFSPNLGLEFYLFGFFILRLFKIRGLILLNLSIFLNFQLFLGI